jgi:glycosyltransferase involved in cell wall biosynthesis
MHILHLITSINKGGAENHLFYLAKEQIKNNKVSVIYFKGDGYWKSNYNRLGIKTINLSKQGSSLFDNIKKILFVRNFISKEKVNIAHAHLPHMEILMFFVLLFKKFDIKYFITKHVDNNFLGGSRYKSKSILASFIDYLLTNKATSIICISKAVKEYYVQSFLSHNKNKYKLVYYGIDSSCLKFLKSKKENYQIPKNKIIFGSIGRLVKQKNYEHILRSFKEFTKINKTSAVLVIAGSGPEEKKLKNLSIKLGINKKVIWLGFVNDIGKFLKKIDIFCMNSNWEGLGLVLLEAMYFKKPIIAPRISAIPEVIVNNFNGYLVKPNNVRSYSLAMSKIIDKKISKKFSKNSKIVLNENFDYIKMVTKIKKIYLT